MLPVSIYNRSVLSADGAALASALVVTALCFSAVRIWAGLGALAVDDTLRAQQAAADRIRAAGGDGGPDDGPAAWSSLALVVVPSFILSPLWVLAVSADVAAWRLLEAETHPREHFDPLWKLSYMWEHPLHFPLAAWTALIRGDRLWEELIGILGWQDIVLPGIYFC